jgi:hypothetical protein
MQGVQAEKLMIWLAYRIVRGKGKICEESCFSNLVDNMKEKGGKQVGNLCTSCELCVPTKLVQI